MMESEWIENLKSSRANRLKLEGFRKEVERGEYRRFSSEDSNRHGIPVVVVEATGKGENEYFKRLVRCYADVGKVGFFYATAVLYDETKSFRCIRRFAVKGDRVLILTKFDGRPFLAPWELASNEERLQKEMKGVIERNRGKNKK